MIYTVEMDEPRDDTVCRCGSCSWNGRFNQVVEIGGCALTPGDASPAGRCPKCDGLVYPDVIPLKTGMDIIKRHASDE
jgi:hypothetical protein